MNAPLNRGSPIEAEYKKLRRVLRTIFSDSDVEERIIISSVSTS
jgi:hypothetical protein